MRTALRASILQIEQRCKNVHFLVKIATSATLGAGRGSVATGQVLIEVNSEAIDVAAVGAEKCGKLEL